MKEKHELTNNNKLFRWKRKTLITGKKKQNNIRRIFRWKKGS